MPSLRRFQLDPLLLGLAFVLLLAWLYPAWGAHSGPLHPALVNKLAAAAVFFVSGVTLPFAELRRGAAQWRAHALVQATTFLSFPLFGLLCASALRSLLPADLILGVVYLCALASTVSSSVALTALAGGNVAVAVFNATCSSLLGVVLTPLWLQLSAGASGHTLPLAHVMLNLFLWLVLPLGLGQLARRVLAAWAQKHLKALRVFDRVAILFLVYTAFCDSFQARVWQQFGWGTPLLALACSALVLALALWSVNACCRALKLSHDVRIAVAFCGSTKSLATGVMMAPLVFQDPTRVGLILLPILSYHPLQLVVCGVLARRWARPTPQ